MFEDLITNLKSHSSKISKSCSLENLKVQTNKFAENINAFRNHTTHLSDNIFSSVKNYKIVKDFTGTSKSPSPSRRDLKWPVLVNNKMQWVNFSDVYNDKSIDESEVVNKFIRVVSIEEENCLNSAKKRRNDREEIRRRLAMGSDSDDYYGGERHGRKPSLQARLQSGMNLQICFMNETMSDTESPCSDNELPKSPSEQGCKKSVPHSPVYTTQTVLHAPIPVRPSPSSLTLPLHKEPLSPVSQPMTEADFFARQARLQAEARMALAQAKEMAHMQMEIERQRQKKSPITEIVRNSLEKVGIPFPEDRRRVSRQILTDMNVAQLQVIVNDLHTQIEILNERLVKYLMDRDDFHMEQDSMLVDIEDLTRYLGAKEHFSEELLSPSTQNQIINNNSIELAKPKLNRISNSIKK